MDKGSKNKDKSSSSSPSKSQGSSAGAGSGASATQGGSKVTDKSALGYGSSDTSKVGSSVTPSETTGLLSSRGNAPGDLKLTTVAKIKHTFHKRLESQRRHRLFIEPGPPLPSSAEEEDEETPAVGADTQFKYIKGNRWMIFRKWVQEGVEGFEAKKYTILLLVVIAIIADGVRPIMLVWAKDGNKQYPFMFSTWVVLVKVMVLIFSLTMLWISRKYADTQSEDVEEGEPKAPITHMEKFKLSFYLLPSTLCYLFSDILNFFLFTRISATAFSVVKQSRIVLTAIMFRFVLKRSVSVIQWLAVVQLTLASMLFVASDLNAAPPQEAPCPSAGVTAAPKTTAEEAAAENASFLFGIMLLLLKCFIDTLAVIWMDFFFKKFDDAGFPYAEQQVWVAIQSLIGGIAYFIAVDARELEGGRGLFDGYTTGAWASAVLTGFYGILVSLILRWTDSMVKMAQALLSVALTILLDWELFGEYIDITKGIAIAFILINVFLYKLGAVTHA